MTERVIRGVPLWLLREYVVGVGAQVEGDGWLQGDGWRAELTQLDDYVIGSLRVGQVRLVIEGEADSVTRAWAALEPKLLRGGG